MHKMVPPECVPVFLKDFYATRHLDFLFRVVIPLLPHGNDGIIFTSLHSPYVIGTNKNIVKWKPPYLNTIDFLI